MLSGTAKFVSAASWLILLAFALSATAEPAAASVNYRYTWGAYGTGLGQFELPYGLALGAGNRVFVADSDNARIQSFSLTGAPITTWGSDGFGFGKFIRPRGVAVSPRTGNVIVADTDGNQIEEYTPDGQFVRGWGKAGKRPGRLSVPAAIAVDRQSHIYVADRLNNRVQKFDERGRLMSIITDAGGSPLEDPTGVAVDRDGNLYVVAEGDAWIHKFSPAGRFLGEWGAGGKRNHLGGSGGLRDPFGIAIDPWDRVWVADLDDARLVRFRQDGNFDGAFGTRGDEPGAFHGPYGLAIDCRGTLYVTDTFRARVDVFDQEPPATSCVMPTSRVPTLVPTAPAPPVLTVRTIEVQARRAVTATVRCVRACRLSAFVRFEGLRRHTTTRADLDLRPDTPTRIHVSVPARLRAKGRRPRGKLVVSAASGQLGAATTVGRPF